MLRGWQADYLNYADINDIFSRTTIAYPDDIFSNASFDLLGQDHTIPNYRDPPPRRVMPWFIVRRALPKIREYESLIPRLDAPGGASNAEEIKEAFEKTFSEIVTFFSILRLAFFVFHMHYLLFLCCLLLNHNSYTETWYWCLCASEVAMIFIKNGTQGILLQAVWTVPPVLDLVELALGLTMGGAMAVDYFRVADRRDRCTYLFDQAWLNLTFLVVILLIAIVREVARLVWKWNLGFWSKVYAVRFLIILMLGVIDFLAGYFLLLPAVTTVSFRLCDCHQTASACDITSPRVLCYLATVLLYIVIFLSYTMFTAITWMLLSLIWSFSAGLMTSVGAVQYWGAVQSSMDVLIKQLDLYSPYGAYYSEYEGLEYHESYEGLDAQEQKEQAQLDRTMVTKDARYANSVNLALQHFIHLWHRDLISVELLKTYRTWDFKMRPASEEACILTLTQLNCHKGLFKYVYGSHEELKGFDKEVRDVCNYKMRKNISVSMQSVFSMRSVTYFVPLYAETVIYTYDQLKSDGVLDHFTDLYRPEWHNFCSRVMHNAPPTEVAKAFFEPSRALARLFVKHWAVGLQKLQARIDAWPPRAKSTQWTASVGDYPLTLGYAFFPHDPPPVLPVVWAWGGQGLADDDSLSDDNSQILDKLQYWCEQQV